MLFWLLLIGSSQLKADISLEKETIDVVLDNYKGIVDVCEENSKKEVGITVNIGNISKTDQLFGYNFEIGYDGKLMRFNSPLFMGTISEFFDIDKRNMYFYGGDTGLVTGYAYTFGSTPIYGNSLPLLAFKGLYYGLCPDTSEVFLSYLEFTDEYIKEIAKTINAKIYAIVKDKEDRYIKINIDEDTLNTFDKDSCCIIKAIINIGRQDARIQSTDFIIELEENDIFTIKDVFSNNINYKIDNIIKDINKYIVKTTVYNEIDLDTLFIRVYNKEIASGTKKINVISNNVNNCACITRYYGDTILIDYKHVISGNIIDDITDNKAETFVYYKDNTIIITDKNSEIKRIKLYDINGIEIYTFNNEQRINEINIDTFSLNNGVYYMKIDKKTKEEIKRILIIN